MKKVLLIEDDKFLVRVYKMKLQKEGIEALFLENGQMAKETAKKEKPDLILVDLMMPVKDGFETIRELKSDPETSPIPVVVLSALGTESDIKTATDLGAKEYFVKSTISLNEVIDVIRKYL